MPRQTFANPLAIQIDCEALMSRVPGDAREFSLVCGGPLYRLMVKLRLIKPSVGQLRRRILVMAGLAWLPLLALSLIEGRAVDGVALPLLSDVATNAKFLLALPMVLVAEVILHRRLADAVPQFTRRGLVPPELVPRFDAAVASALRWRDSMTVELLLLAFAFVAIPLAWRHTMVPVSTWIADGWEGGARFTRAGWWLVHVSAPLLQFLLLRMYFRLFVWGRFLWQVSRMPLQLAPSHPDRAGGLSFLEESIPAFAPLLLAQGIAVSGLLARRAQMLGVSVFEFKLDVAIVVVALVALVLLPMCLLAPSLAAMRRKALFEYGELAANYVRQFDDKWLAGSTPPEEPLVGTADVQSLADMGGSYEIVSGARPVPFSLRAVMQLLIIAVAPFLPLAFTVYSLRDVVTRLLKMML
jgi:hypothetical protein